MAAGICFMFGIYENQITKLTNMLPAFHYEIIRKKEWHWEEVYGGTLYV